MYSLKFTVGKHTFSIDRAGFANDERRVSWTDIQSCTEVSVPGVDLGIAFHLVMQLPSAVLKFSDQQEHGCIQLPEYGYYALRVVAKEILPDKVKLLRPRYLKFGPGECELTLSLARFLHEIGLGEESKFAYSKAIELIEYYHNPRHQLLVEPLIALSSMLKESQPERSKEYKARARSIESGPAEDMPFFKSLTTAWSKKDRIKRAFEEFRNQHGREPRPVEKARILKELEHENS